jgi:sortase B
MMVFVGAAGVLANHYVEGWRAEKALSGLEPVNIEFEDLQTDKGIVAGKYAGLYTANPDIIGWLKIEDTHINYPVMQTQNDPEFYLRRDFKKEYSLSGTPFMDAASDIFVPTCNWMIYGHHMKDGTMFKDLVKYADYKFYQDHKYITFDTIYKDGQGTYEVVAAFYAEVLDAESNEFKYYQYAGITTETQLKEYVKGVKKMSEYDTGVNVAYGEQLITLSTCNYHVRDGKGRFAVVAKRIK